jgi:HEAT repeat protein
VAVKKLSDLPFPEPPDGADDPELWSLLVQYEFIRWVYDQRPQGQEEYREVVGKLTQPACLARLEKATREHEPLFRWRAYCFLIAYWREQRLDLIARVLDDADSFVRDKAAWAMASICHPQIEGRLIELVLCDPSADVRCGACHGLSGQNPLAVIPTLLKVLDTDRVACENGWSVSHCAADALDTLMGTEFMAKRRGSLATFPDGPQDPAAVRQHAIEYLKKLRENE